MTVGRISHRTAADSVVADQVAAEHTPVVDLIAQVLADNYRNGTKNLRGAAPSRRMRSVTDKIVRTLRGAGYRIVREHKPTEQAAEQATAE